MGGGVGVAAADFHLACRETQNCICALKSLSGDARPSCSLFARFWGPPPPTTPRFLAPRALSLSLQSKQGEVKCRGEYE
jgi:hypothetical protein